MDDGIDPVQRVRIELAFFQIPTHIAGGSGKGAHLVAAFAERIAERRTNQAAGTGDENGSDI
jgi:hypothetical protein